MTSTPYDNFDFSLMKAVSIEEMLKVQFRAEFFNVFNIQNYGLPGQPTGRAASEWLLALPAVLLPGRFNSARDLRSSHVSALRCRTSGMDFSVLGQFAFRLRF